MLNTLSGSFVYICTPKTAVSLCSVVSPGQFSIYVPQDDGRHSMYKTLPGSIFYLYGTSRRGSLKIKKELCLCCYLCTECTPKRRSFYISKPVMVISLYFLICVRFALSQQKVSALTLIQKSLCFFTAKFCKRVA
jgi:hypothetical protein